MEALSSRAAPPACVGALVGRPGAQRRTPCWGPRPPPALGRSYLFPSQVCSREPIFRLFKWSLVTDRGSACPTPSRGCWSRDAIVSWSRRPSGGEGGLLAPGPVRLSTGTARPARRGTLACHSQTLPVTFEIFLLEAYDHLVLVSGSGKWSCSQCLHDCLL